MRRAARSARQPGGPLEQRGAGAQTISASAAKSLARWRAGLWACSAVLALGGPYFGWLAVLPFYLLELLVGLVEALVFALLTSVFTALMCEHHDEDHAH